MATGIQGRRHRLPLDIVAQRAKRRLSLSKIASYGRHSEAVHLDNRFCFCLVPRLNGKIDRSRRLGILGGMCDNSNVLARPVGDRLANEYLMIADGMYSEGIRPLPAPRITKCQLEEEVHEGSGQY